MLRIALLAAAALLPALPAAAQDRPPDRENGRYSLNQVDEGYLRLDQQTGRLSLCTRRTLGWACHPVPDERTALEEEIARLQKDNAILKKQMLAQGMPLPGVKPSPAQPSPAKPEAAKPETAKPEAGADSSIKVPSDADLDKAMATVEKIWRQLVEMVQRLQKELPPI